ncbi:MAG TPA: glycosyltransferase [Terriglobales bacterium]|jgi:glycosyltransferase involved in cell wall biosynthesis|nr:glycosyltransferase [Terriglobales bacterium]
MALVSIIMNVRNGAAFLREALDSVMAQTVSDWELIVWDDCSTDNSAKIIDEYREERLRYFLSPEEVPLGQARDRAIRQATADWLAFLDQDDIWLPCKLEKQIPLAEHNVGIIYGRTVLFNRHRGNLRDYDYAHEFTALPEGDIFPSLFRDACFIAMSSVMLHRSAIAEVGGIPDSIQVVPDYYLYTAIARRYKARAVQEVVCRYRIHAASMTRSHQHRLRLHAEPLSIVEQWAACLDPQVAAYRRMTYSTALALEEIKEFRTLRGLRRLFTSGSVLWLLSRPAAILWRSLRRKLRRPYWKVSTGEPPE